MEDATAKQLLNQIAQVKQAEIDRGTLPLNHGAPANYLGGIWDSITGFMVPKSKTPITDRHAASQAKKDAFKTVITGMLLGGGAGVAARGLTGLSNIGQDEDEDKTAPGVLDIDVPVKQASSATTKEAAPSMYGEPLLYPGLAVGVPLATWGGWKGLDLLLNKQRESKSKAEIADAKREYEEEVAKSFKTAETLDRVIDGLSATPGEKRAGIADDLPGMLGGLALAYAATSGPLGYMMVDEKMKKNSKRKILEKAQKERKRRQSPSQIYAKPVEMPEVPLDATESSEEPEEGQY